MNKLTLFKTFTAASLAAIALILSGCGQQDTIYGGEIANSPSGNQAPDKEIADLLQGATPLPTGALAQSSDTPENYLANFFPGAGDYAADLPLPHDALGFAPGEMHITPEAQFYYLSALAAASPKAQIETIGYSHEKRPLAHFYISSPENIANLEALREQHISASKPGDDILIVKLAYSIHGNEPSGANAVPLIAYYLTASQDEWVQDFLARTIVIIEPVQNPDGLARFATWANMHRTQVDIWDSAQRNQHQSWPSGRTNHYWFDLNRDWIFTVHPESQARIEQYHRWKPHVLGDYHEMGGDKPSYFFQPGHPKRTHPLTLDKNQSITAALAKFHAAALDRAGQDYYSGERFDDFYYGKGSAYPDITGGIGLLFEQTGVRGQTRDFDGEHLTFNQSISNQITTSFSLMRGADSLRDDILAYRFAFDAAEKHRAANAETAAYVFGDDGDPMRAQALITLLTRHKVSVHALKRSVTQNDVNYEPGHAWVVPANAAQYGFVTSLFETRTSFEDNVFYDVSTWNLPTGFNLPYAGLSKTGGLLGQQVSAPAGPEPLTIDTEAVAYAMDWNQLGAPKLLQVILHGGIVPRVAALPFSVDLMDGTRRSFTSGTVIVRLRNDDIANVLQEAAGKVPGVTLHALASGLTYEGPDLGSRDMGALHPVRPALLVGEGINTTEAGAMWYFLDARLGIPATLLDLDRVSSTDLSAYTHLLMVDGSYAALGDDVDALRDWVKQGGVLVAQKRAAEWAQKRLLADDDEDEDEEDVSSPDDETENTPVYNPYQAFETDNGDRMVRGSVFRAHADLTHPFAFGLQDETVHVFRTWSKTLKPAKISYDTPFRYTDTPLVSGFAGRKKLEKIAGSPALALHRVGDGKIITISDDLVFRGVWRGSERIYANILYFSQTIEDRKDD